ncbi:MAG TPA: DNA internalization-related competence protein ComEC/Rec2 [Anaerolineae bacterium]|nr:DNA internalization-related competence protein ComEC/Rec2 [Anaerolineae bacterium]
MTLPYLVFGWLAGIYIQSGLRVPAWLLWLATPLLFTIFVLWSREWRVRLGAACALLALLGALRYETSLPSFDASTLAYYNGAGEVTVVGIVAEEPDVRDRYVNLKVSASYLETEGQRHGVKGLVLVQTARHPSYAYGDELQIDGRLETPPELEDFSYRDYLARQGIHSMMRYGRITVLSQGHGDPFHRTIYALKGHLQETIARLFPEPSASLLTGILLGVETGIPRSLLEDFNATSTTHIIAISGFNIAIVGGAIGLLTRRFLGIYRSALVSVLAIAVYTVLVGADAAVVRAAVMGTLSLIAIIAGRQTYALASLAAAAFVMTLWNPLLLWDVGFELSFAATLGLVVLVRPMEEGFRALLSRLQSEERAASIVRLLSEPLLITAAAQLAVWPITLYYFHRLSLVSPLTNFLIIPAQPAVMIVGGLATLLGALRPLLGQPVAWVAWLFLAYTIGIVELTARLPLTGLELGGFSAGAMWLHYALFVGVVLAARQDRSRLREIWGGLTQRLNTKLMIGGLALAVILTWIAALQMPDGRLHVHFLDVGQGDAIFIQCPNGQQILVDGGPSPSVLLSHLGRRMPFWDHSLDLVVLTHPEDDHLGGLVDVLTRYDVSLVLDSGQVCTSATCKAWRSLIGEKEIPYRRAESGMRLELGQGVQIEVLHPPTPLMTNTASDINNNSVVLRLQYGQFSALLTGDVMEEAENTLLMSGRPLDSLVLKVPHHGGDTSLTKPFLEAVSPELAIISVGSDNHFGHPHQATLEKLEGILSYQTVQDGSIEVISDGSVYWLRTDE